MKTNRLPAKKTWLGIGLLSALACLLVSAAVFGPISVPNDPPKPTSTVTPHRMTRTPSATVPPRDTHTPKPTDYKGCGTIFAPDSDCDNIPDTGDNCPSIANPDQDRRACAVDGLYRLSGPGSETVIYLIDGGVAFFSPAGKRLGEVTSGGLVKIDPSLRLRQVVGSQFDVIWIGADGQHTTRFTSRNLNFGLSAISAIAVNPPTAQMRVGETRQFTATAYETSGIELWFLPRWTTTGGGVISRNGLFTAQTPGTFTISACRYGNVCGTTRVAVTQ